MRINAFSTLLHMGLYEEILKNPPLLLPTIHCFGVSVGQDVVLTGKEELERSSAEVPLAQDHPLHVVRSWGCGLL